MLLNCFPAFSLIYSLTFPLLVSYKSDTKIHTGCTSFSQWQKKYSIRTTHFIRLGVVTLRVPKVAEVNCIISENWGIAALELFANFEDKKKHYFGKVISVTKCCIHIFQNVSKAALGIVWVFFV